MDKEFVFDSDVPNDVLDIYATPDIHIKKIKTENINEFRIELEGNSVDNSVVNALRRTCDMSIPIYAFHRSNIFIELDKSRHMYNNDLIYNQIETVPIFDIPNYFDLENPEIFLSNEVLKNLFGNFIQKKYEESGIEESNEQIDDNKKLFKIELSINAKNNSDVDKFVSTHDTILKVNGQISNSYKIRRPISILVLKPSEEISLRAEANLGISKINAIYEATTNVVLEEISPMKYQLSFETLEQLEKNVIFLKACVILEKKLENLKKYIMKKYQNEVDIPNKIEILLYGEDHTLGNLIATTLQKCDFIEKAGYNMPHPFIDQIIIIYQIKNKSKIKPIDALIDTINYLVKLFQSIAHISQKNK